MNNSYQCPFCSSVMALTKDTISIYKPSFYHDNETALIPLQGGCSESTIEISFIKCPKCKEYSIYANGIGESIKDVSSLLRPKSLAKKFPQYIPEPIREDYEEACAIVDLSPKASATLSRRCLQGMIRDFWEVSKPTLFQEIDAVKGKVSAEQWNVLDGVRRIGNIGAHMEKDINLIVDIEPEEAIKLIKLIELLLQQWYIERYNQQQLYSDIIGIDESKKSKRKKTE